VSVAAVLLLTAILYAPSPPPNYRARFDSKEFPVKAFASLGVSAEQSRIFTFDQWGDYMFYKQYPKGQVFIDGRSDFYGRRFEQKYLDIVTVKYNWQQYLNEYGVDTVMLPTDAALAGALKESSRWHVVYDDGDAIVFRTGARAEGSQVSAVINGGKDRDRKITNTQTSDRTITKTKT
jgi:sarcosine oxidase delta subunit